MSVEELVKDFLAQKIYAVVGSFKNEEKYAYKIVKTLIKKGYDVYPVNPRFDYVEGKKCYKKVSDIPVVIDVVDLVVSPLISEKIVQECYDQKIKRVWLQPGAENESVLKYCNDKNIKVVHGVCVMLESI